jgi:hypothetical protein
MRVLNDHDPLSTFRGSTICVGGHAMSTEDEARSSDSLTGRSAARYGDAERIRRGGPLIVYEFEQVDKLLQGWQVHVVTQRLIHEDAARRIQTLHYGLGGPAVILAALAGSSAVAAWSSGGSSGGLALLSAFIAVGATVLTAVVTFLDLGGRAERHRRAAAECKRILRRLEALPPYHMRLADMPEELNHNIQELESQLGEMDSSAPIPPRRIAERVLTRPRELRSAVVFAPDQPS